MAWKVCVACSSHQPKGNSSEPLSRAEIIYAQPSRGSEEARVTSEGTFCQVSQVQVSETSRLFSADGVGSVWGPCCQLVGVRGPEGPCVLERQRGFPLARVCRRSHCTCTLLESRVPQRCLQHRALLDQILQDCLEAPAAPDPSPPHLDPSTAVSLTPADRLHSRICSQGVSSPVVLDPEWNRCPDTPQGQGFRSASLFWRLTRNTSECESGLAFSSHPTRSQL